MLVGQTDISTIKTLIRSERSQHKIRDVTVPLDPSWTLMCTNEWLNFHRDGHFLIAEPKNSLSSKMSSEHLDSIRARILEVFFRKQSENVLPAVFSADIQLHHAKIALSLLILKAFKTMEHPKKLPAAILIPSALKGIRSVEEKIPNFMDIDRRELSRLMADYEKMYISEINNEMAGELGQEWPEKMAY